MDLTNKLKSYSKALALVGILANPVHNSGCVPAAMVTSAAIIAQGEKDAAEKQAQAMRDAAIWGQTTPSTTNPPVVIQRQNRFFAAKAYKGDLNRNGIYEFEEYSEVGNEFKPGQPFLFGTEIFNREGADLELFYYKIEPEGKKLFHSEKKVNIPRGYWIYALRSHFNEGLPAGIYLATYKIGSEEIGSVFIEIK